MKKLLEKPSGYFRFLLNEFCRIALHWAASMSM